MEIVQIFGIPRVEVGESVIPYGMAGVEYVPEHVGMLAHVVAYAKERGFGIVLLELIKHPRCDFRHGAVVEGKE